MSQKFHLQIFISEREHSCPQDALHGDVSEALWRPSGCVHRAHFSLTEVLTSDTHRDTDGSQLLLSQVEEAREKRVQRMTNYRKLQKNSKKPVTRQV